MQLLVNEEVFKAFALCSLIIVIKMFVLTLWTAKKRMENKAFANPEDASKYKTVVAFHCDDVERVRRNHLNDLENILPYVIIGLFYLFTNPTPHVAVWHYRVFAGSRVAHTIAYTFIQSNKLRGLSFGIGFGACLSMLVQSIMFYTV